MKWLISKKPDNPKTGTAALRTFFGSSTAVTPLPPPPPPQTARASGRLLFALDATGSRQPTWDKACGLQLKMFETVAGLGSLTCQLAWFGGAGFRNGTWVDNALALGDQMSGVHCVSGGTQITRVLEHALSETKAKRISAVLYVGDCMEEDANHLVNLAKQLGACDTPVFMFQEAYYPGVGDAYALIAQASGGAHLPFDLANITKLSGLLGAVAIFAVSGLEGLNAASAVNSGARLLLAHLKK